METPTSYRLLLLALLTPFKVHSNPSIVRMTNAIARVHANARSGLYVCLNEQDKTLSPHGECANTGWHRVKDGAYAKHVFNRVMPVQVADKVTGKRVSMLIKGCISTYFPSVEWLSIAN